MGFSLHASNCADPPEVRNWRIHAIAIIVSMGSIAMGYDTSVIGGTMALDTFRRDFGLTNVSEHDRDTLQGNIVSTFQAGTFFGALLTFPIGEAYGRKKALMLAISIFLCGGALMTAASGHLPLLYTGRAIAGFGIGAVSLLVPVYIAETAPPSIRGRLIGIFEICSQAGGMAGFWINYVCDRVIPDTAAQWQVPLGLQLVPGVVLLVGVCWCPETPRWLARQGRWGEARGVLAVIRGLDGGHEFVEGELRDVRDQLSVDEGPREMGGWARCRWYAGRLGQRGTRNRIGIGLLLMAFQNLTGVNIITYYSPRIFETLGLTGTSTKLFATGFYGIAKTLGMVIFSVWLVEKLGRRQGLIWGAFVGSLPMWYLGGYVFKADPTAAAARGDSSRDGWGYLAMVCVYLYGLIYCATWQGITWVICSEIFPIDIRMLCVAITTADQWLWSFVISRTTPYMITSLGYGTYMFFAALMVLMGVWAWFCIPETKGKTLEDMDAIFGAPSVVGMELGGKDELDAQGDVEQAKAGMTAHVERV